MADTRHAGTATAHDAGFLNVRPPQPVSPEFLQAQDAELRQQLADKGIVALQDIPSCRSDSRLRLWQGDITRLQVDVIVNAANSALLGCFVPLHRCTDNAIHSAAGVQLRLECDRLMQAQGHPEPTGCAKMTKGYNLPARYVLHTVGPIVRDGNTLLLELGVGYNTPTIIRFPFERLAVQRKNITLVRINKDYPNAQDRMANLFSFDENMGSILTNISTSKWK